MASLHDWGIFLLRLSISAVIIWLGYTYLIAPATYTDLEINARITGVFFLITGIAILLGTHERIAALLIALYYSYVLFKNGITTNIYLVSVTSSALAIALLGGGRWTLSGHSKPNHGKMSPKH
jgi:hypothetical protein